MEYESAFSVVLRNPLFLAITVAVVVFAGFRFVAWRAKEMFWKSAELVITTQFHIATQREVQSLMAAADRMGKRDFATAKLEELRRQQGDAVKLGQLWWTWWQLRGLVSGNTRAPSCNTRDDGLNEQSMAELNHLPVTELMKKW